jgi:cation diffusion facilitator CzcD-associated flavoprotein CzcO
MPHQKQVVEDDYMYDFKYNVSLPTVDRLGTSFAEGTDVAQVAQDFVDELERALNVTDGDALAGLFLEDGESLLSFFLFRSLPGRSCCVASRRSLWSFVCRSGRYRCRILYTYIGVWRDKVVFTWEYRTFNGVSLIKSAAQDLLPRTPTRSFRVISPGATLEHPYPDLQYVQVHFAFDTDKVGASAVANLVQTKEGVKVWTLHTAIESLLDFPELPNRDGHMVGPLSWMAQRELDTRFEAQQPDVVIIGGGHNGLMMAARLKALGVPALVVERNDRVGDNWRKRYEALSLHFPHWADHLPYMPYPDHWPVYTPAAKLGDWLEWYASAMELYIWTQATVASCHQSAEDGSWELQVDRIGHERRKLTPKHVVMATSLAGVPMLPSIPGMEGFQGTVRHSTAHDSSREWIGKRVLVVGTSSSGFDTAYDFARRDIDVTILQRSPTYLMSLTHSVPRIIGSYEPKKGGAKPDLDQVDRAAYSMPVGPGEELGRRLAGELAELDKKLIDDMEASGFKTYLGQRETGTQTLGYTRNGGFYFDAGACEQVIQGKIKVAQGAIERQVHRFRTTKDPSRVCIEM